MLYCSIYFLFVFQIGYFLLFYLSFHWFFPLLSSFCYWHDHCLFSFWLFYFNLVLHIFYFFTETFYFLFAWEISVIVHWSIFMMADLACLSHNSNTCIILVLLSLNCLFLVIWGQHSGEFPGLVFCLIISPTGC